MDIINIMIESFHGINPVIASNAYIAINASIIGDVKIESDVNVWYNSVIRGDFNTINIGAGSNIQDNSVLHVDVDEPLNIRKKITIGHNCIIHGCKIDNYCLIGMGSIIMNRVEIGSNCIIGAGTLITQNTIILYTIKYEKQLKQSFLPFIAANHPKVILARGDNQISVNQYSEILNEAIHNDNRLKA